MVKSSTSRSSDAISLPFSGKKSTFCNFSVGFIIYNGRKCTSRMHSTQRYVNLRNLKQRQIVQNGEKILTVMKVFQSTHASEYYSECKDKTAVYMASHCVMVARMWVNKQGVQACTAHILNPCSLCNLEQIGGATFHRLLNDKQRCAVFMQRATTNAQDAPGRQVKQNKIRPRLNTFKIPSGTQWSSHDTKLAFMVRSNYREKS